MALEIRNGPTKQTLKDIFFHHKTVLKRITVSEISNLTSPLQCLFLSSVAPQTKADQRRRKRDLIEGSKKRQCK